MKVIGLTGGIGMGKSTAGRLLAERGIPVADTDDLARRVVEPGQPALEEIKQTFGMDVIAPDGTLLRHKLAGIVFCSPEKRLQLERITHPRIRDLWRGLVDTWRAEGRRVAVVVIPLLFETAAEEELDATICVACSKASQLKRLSERKWRPEEIERRIAAQWTVERKMAGADYVAWSEGEIAVLSEQLDRIVRRVTA